MTEKKNNNTLHVIALISVIIVDVGSLYFMFNAGRHQKSVPLLTLFTGWILAPYMGFFAADKISAQWNMRRRFKCWWLTIIISIASLVCYSGILMPKNAKFHFCS